MTLQTPNLAQAAVGDLVAPLNDGAGVRPERAATCQLSLVGGLDSPIPPPYATSPLPTYASCEWAATSLFAGGGGLDLGFTAEGIRVEAAYDNSRLALVCRERALPGVSRLADLQRHTPSEQFPVLLAGAPCQGFSTVGRRDVEDPRNGLLKRVADITILRRPKALIVENVPAALSGRHGHHWKALEDRLRLAGYNVRRLLMTGEESGIPQRRRRLFLICWLGSDCVRFEIDTIPAPSLRSALADVNGLPDHRPHWPVPQSVDGRVAARIGPGQKLSNVRTSGRAVPTWEVPEVFGTTDAPEQRVLRAVSLLRRRARKRNWGDGDPVEMEALARELQFDPTPAVISLVERGYLRQDDEGVELRHTYNGKYRRLAWNELSPTVDTHFGRPSLFLHPEEDRGLSVREAARIQGFSDAYLLPVGRKEAYEIIGNAVPPPMAGRLAAFVREALLKIA